MATEPLQYADPATPFGNRAPRAQSISVGIVSWCLIGGAVATFYVILFACRAFHFDSLDAAMMGGGIAILLLITETVAAVYGLLCALIDLQAGARRLEAVAGMALNLTALSPLAILVLMLVSGR